MYVLVAQRKKGGEVHQLMRFIKLPVGGTPVVKLFQAG